MHRFFVVMLCLLVAMPAMATDAVKTHIPNASAVGSGNLTVMVWNVYDATLYAPSGKWNASEPFALAIKYNRDIDGVDIADRSAEEIRGLGFSDEMKLAAWHSQMLSFFPNVTSGTKLTGIYQQGEPTVFYVNDKRAGEVQDPEFGKWFFDIWLSEKTSEPALRAALLGQ